MLFYRLVILMMLCRNEQSLMILKIHIAYSVSFLLLFQWLVIMIGSDLHEGDSYTFKEDRSGLNSLMPRDLFYLVWTVPFSNAGVPLSFIFLFCCSLKMNSIDLWYVVSVLVYTVCKNIFSWHKRH